MISRIIRLLTFPVRYFWEYYNSIDKEEAPLWEIILYAVVAGLVTIAYVLLFILLVTRAYAWGLEHPIILLGTIAIIWTFFAVRSKMAEETARTEKIRVTNAYEQAEQGYHSMLQIMYKALSRNASEMGGIRPKYMAEIESPDQKYFLQNNVCIYQFMLEKENSSNFVDETILREYANGLQFQVRRILQSSDCPVKIQAYRDSHGRGYDGILIDHVQDIGRYYDITVAYASDGYIEYKQQKEALRFTRESVTAECSETWDD